MFMALHLSINFRVKPLNSVLGSAPNTEVNFCLYWLSINVLQMMEFPLAM